MSKITNDGLTRSGTGCFIAVSTATVGINGLNDAAVRPSVGSTTRIAISVGALAMACRAVPCSHNATFSNLLLLIVSNNQGV